MKNDMTINIQVSKKKSVGGDKPIVTFNITSFSKNKNRRVLSFDELKLVKSALDNMSSVIKESMQNELIWKQSVKKNIDNLISPHLDINTNKQN